MKKAVTCLVALFILAGVGAAPSASAAAARQAAAPSLDDATIFAIFDELNAIDIWTARLGVRNCHSPEVCDLARAVAGDHEQVQQMMRDLAHKLAITPVPPADDTNAQSHAKTVAQLQGKSGAAFDRAYVLHELEFHRGAVNGVKQTLLPAIRNDEFKALVQKLLPGLEQHLAATEQLAGKLGYR